MKLISSEVIIDLVKRRFKPIDSNWESDSLDIITEGVSSIFSRGGRLGLELTWTPVTVKNNKARVPQAAEHLELIIYKGERLNKAMNRAAMPPSSVTASDRANVDAIEELRNLTVRYETLQTMIDGTTDVDLALEYQAKQQEILTEMLALNKVLVDPDIPQPTGTEYYFEQGHYITTSFESGEILVYYMKYFTDDKGYPMIVDEHNYRQAIYYYFISELLMQGYKNENLSYKDAFALHEEFAQRAANQMNTWGVEEHEQFSKMTVRMKPNYNLGNSNFKGL